MNELLIDVCLNSNRLFYWEVGNSNFDGAVIPTLFKNLTKCNQITSNIKELRKVEIVH